MMKGVTMSDSVRAEVRYAALFLLVDARGYVWGLGHDEMMNADNRRDRDRLVELGAITCEGPGYYRVNPGYADCFTTLS